MPQPLDELWISTSAFLVSSLCPGTPQDSNLAIAENSALAAIEACSKTWLEVSWETSAEAIQESHPNFKQNSFAKKFTQAESFWHYKYSGVKKTKQGRWQVNHWTKLPDTITPKQQPGAKTQVAAGDSHQTSNASRNTQRVAQLKKVEAMQLQRVLMPQTVLWVY